MLLVSMNLLTRYIRKAVRTRGFDMIHYAPWKNLFETFHTDLILDIGANIGQTYDSFRWAGYEGPICSFEPNPDMFRLLEQRNGDQWQRLQYALSSRSGELKFYITDNDNACSLQVPLGNQFKILKEINVPTLRLDELWSKKGFSAKNVFLKVDAEGHDLEVIKGAAGIMDKISLIMAEVSPLSRYEGEPAMHEFLDFMAGMGFRVCRVDKNCLNPAAGIDTALDIIFAKHDALAQLGLKSLS
jgi:FkbM family methyltransferase